MTREQIEALFRSWAPRLRLGHWTITFDWTKPSPKGTWAAVTFEDSYDVAIVRVGAEHDTWDPTVGEQVVVHELMHLVMRDAQRAVELTHKLLEPQARRLARVQFDHELEGVVDRMATVLVDIDAEYAGFIPMEQA